MFLTRRNSPFQTAYIIFGRLINHSGMAIAGLKE